MLLAYSIVADAKENTMSILAESSVTVIPAGTWSIDPAWSSLEFDVRKLGIVNVKGRVPGFSGSIGGGEAASIEGTVDATSITTFDADRDAHLQSPEYFDTERYPELRFASTAVEATGDEVVVSGELTIKGITKPVELRGTLVGPTNDPWGNERIGLELAGVVDRTDFDLNWNAPLPGGGFLLPSEVVLTAHFAAVRAA
jgi:polyisoprenoid-binding protein YceI